MNFEQRRAARQVMRALADSEVAAEVLVLLRRRYGPAGDYSDDPAVVEIVQRVGTLATPDTRDHHRDGNVVIMRNGRWLE